MGQIGVVNLKEHNITIKDGNECSFYIDRDKKRYVGAFKVSDEVGAVRVSTFDDPEEEDQSYPPDAAHGMVPNAGIGLQTGLEDVGTLLVLLRNLPDPKDSATVLELYSKVRVPRGVAAATFARENRERGMATSVFGGNVNHFMFRMAMSAVNAGVITLYSVFDPETEVAKVLEETKTKTQVHVIE
ncbi:hypothetical protein BCR33DRAFT_435430 [Rhizoclosmatium globosum]|uniref:Uncharacterized protein n=1 Tax=Rhizoclosmatium globosum TaxID=329046 RepID=A0A1Y2BU06_9FUNG|nr:hypothetical protein BCR33DRAFT_435430 [Rhizoclosmatium globosum]|eukprot:ORY38250.1 hypothetical protein BCR33DRAFT_435430 [Rhizoclosmatium globosum]